MDDKDEADDTNNDDGAPTSNELLHADNEETTSTTSCTQFDKYGVPTSMKHNSICGKKSPFRNF